MNLLINKSVKRFMMLLVSVLFAAAVLAQLIAYQSTLRFKNEMIEHDYELAGYLLEKHPEMSFMIQSLFTAEKTKTHIERGGALLGQLGYTRSVRLYLMPRADLFFKFNMAAGFAFCFAISAAVLLLAYLFLKAHFGKIERYNDDVGRIMNGEIATKLDDTDEGSLSKLASSVNALTASLHAHIEKEKNSRVFLKDVLENVSHQLKTPLSALMMYIEIMKDENVDNDVVATFLEKSGNELERMRSLIGNLLKMAKLDAGVIELNIGNHVLNDIIKQAAESFEARMSKERKTFEIKVSGDILYPCDREWMLEALSNLIKNAVEHTSAGGRISAAVEETHLTVRITIEDNGEGIHPDDIKHIFKRFYRSRFSQNKQGTGIGLALAKTIIEMHGGFISVESAAMKGSAFTIHLPRLTKL